MNKETKTETPARPGLKIKLLDFDSIVRNSAGELVTVKKGEVIEADPREGKHLVDAKRAEIVT